MSEPIKACKIKMLAGKSYRCYFELAFQVIGGKWKAVILFHLALVPVMRFGELKRTMPEITERMLTRQLRELESDGLVHREVFREVPPRVEYSLTAFGREVIPLLLHMREWGIAFERHMGGDELFAGDDYEQPEDPCIASCHLEETA